MIIIFYTSCKTTGYTAYVSNEIATYKIEKIDTLVDIGCGNGIHDKNITHQYPNLFLILEDLPVDWNKNDLQNLIPRFLRNSHYAPKIEQNYKFVPGYADSIPLPSLAYKAILCRLTLHEFSNRSKMATELVRIMSNDGILIIVERKPKFEGERDSYCKNLYLSKNEIINTFKDLTLKEEAELTFKTETMAILKFSK